MKLEELIRGVDEASEEDRLALAAHLKHLERVNDPENAVDLDRRMREMDAGQKVSLEDAIRIHEELKAKGL